jgi:hypothetical protein
MAARVTASHMVQIGWSGKAMRVEHMAHGTIRRSLLRLKGCLLLPPYELSTRRERVLGANAKAVTTQVFCVLAPSGTDGSRACCQDHGGERCWLRLPTDVPAWPGPRRHARSVPLRG